MSAVEKPAFAWKVTFQKLLNEHSDNEKKAERQLVLTLEQFTSSSFESDSWVLDRRSNKAHPDTLAFKEFENLGIKGKNLVKLFAIATFNRGSGKTTISLLLKYYQFLSEHSLNLHQVKKDTFASYVAWMDDRINNQNGKPIADVYKHMLLDAALMFHSQMNGHSFMAYIDGVEAIENPYSHKTKDSKYKIIDQEVLDKLDTYFKTETAPLHIRVAYWIMRLYATRPEDTLNYPLDCVKQLTDDMATVKHAIVKNSANKGEVEYKIGFLNLQEPMQRMMFDLIEEQQIISLKLQEVGKKKGFLLTYRHRTNKTIQYLSDWVFGSYLKKFQSGLGIYELKRAVPRDFKKTGITMRMESGWTTPQLKQVANHRTYGSIEAYSTPSESFMVAEQKRLLEAGGQIKGRYVFKGKIINGIGDKHEKSLLANSRAHKIGDLGYCPDVVNCGNHLECMDCSDLIPDKELEAYYLEQVDRYLKIAEKQYEMDDMTNARDSHHRAALFASLYNKIQSGEES